MPRFQVVGPQALEGAAQRFLDLLRVAVPWFGGGGGFKPCLGALMILVTSPPPPHEKLTGAGGFQAAPADLLEKLK